MCGNTCVAEHEAAQPVPTTDFREMAVEKKFRFSIDRRGTFTDVHAECPGWKVRVMKLLSEDPASYPDAPKDAIRRILEEVRDVSTSV